MPSPAPLVLDPRSTALVLIDLQQGIVSMTLEPLSGEETVTACKALARRFREAGALVVPVRVDLGTNLSLAPPGIADRPTKAPPGGLPAGWSTLVEGVADPDEHVITKRHWGAFTGTELDMLLRRRGIGTVVIAGLATNFGVESTARHAWEHGYHVVVAADACSSVSTALHDTSIAYVLPRISRVVQAATIALSGQA